MPSEAARLRIEPELLAILELGAASLDDLAGMLDLPTHAVLPILRSLEYRGQVRGRWHVERCKARLLYRRVG